MNQPTPTPAANPEQPEPTLIYLACPYSSPDPKVRESRFLAVNSAAAELMRQGLHVFSPISHTHPIALAGDLPLGWEFWQAYDRAILRTCKKLIVLKLEGWDCSAGISGEIAIAHEFGIGVEMMDPPTPAVIAPSAETPSETPRTDRLMRQDDEDAFGEPAGPFVVSADFARLLERELTQAQADLRAAQQERDGAKKLRAEERQFSDKLIKESHSLRRELAALRQQLSYVVTTLAPFDCGAAPVEELARRAAKCKMELDAAREALKPFANFACDEPHVGEPMCPNCIARAAIAGEKGARP